MRMTMTSSTTAVAYAAPMYLPSHSSSHTSSYSDDDDLLGDDFSIGESFDDTDDDDLL